MNHAAARGLPLKPLCRGREWPSSIQSDLDNSRFRTGRPTMSTHKSKTYASRFGSSTLVVSRPVRCPSDVRHSLCGGNGSMRAIRAHSAAARASGPDLPAAVEGRDGDYTHDRAASPAELQRVLLGFGADVIEGKWCSLDGQRTFSIDHPRIITPDGATTTATTAGTASRTWSRLARPAPARA
jgi:hypothetical protein